MSSHVVVPPRPRPGRKPIAQEDAADRRRLQNRIAQRNFRDKRQQKLYETQSELEDRKQEWKAHTSDLEIKLDAMRRMESALKTEKRGLEQDLTSWKHRAEHAEWLLSQHGISTQASTGAFRPPVGSTTM